MTQATTSSPAREAQCFSEWFSTLCNIRDGAVIGLSPRFDILFLNEAAEDLYGWRLKGLSGANYLEQCLQDGHTSPLHSELVQQILKSTPGSLHRAKSAVKPAGREREIIEWIVSPVGAKGGDVQGILLMQAVEDVGAQAPKNLRPHERAFGSKKRKTSKPSGDKAFSSDSYRFLAAVSHELRVPLNGILGLIDIIPNEDVAKVDEHYKTLRHSGQNMLALVNDVLDFARLEVGGFVFKQERFDLEDLIHQVTKPLHVLSDKKKVPLLVGVHVDTPCCINGDRNRVRQLFANLVGNALKFTQEGEVRLDVGVQATGPGHAVLSITVKDTGVGIPSDQLEAVFQPFSMMSKKRYEDGFESSGLGLSICKKIVEAMGGKLGVQSKLGEGTLFWVELPVELSMEKAPQSDDWQKTITNLRALLDRAPPLLLVEDHLINQRVAIAMLEKIGCKVDVASTGEEAVEKVNANAYSLVLMDVGLPGISGLEAATEIRKTFSSDALPVIALTGHALDEDINHCFDAGMNDVFIKPITQKALQDLLHKWVVPTS